MSINFRKAMSAAGLLLSIFSVSCGGGGGGGVTGAGAPTESLSAARYAGSYLGNCEAIPDGINVDTGAPLYGRVYQVVGATTTPSAPLEWRLDIYETSDCSGSAIGYVENKSAGSKVTVVGQITVDGKKVDQVFVQFGNSNVVSVAQASIPMVTIGTAFRLSVPAALFSTVQYSDLWYTEGGKLYEGGDLTGPDGYPLALNLADPSSGLSSPLAHPPAPCNATSASWQVGAASCTSSLRASLSGTLLNLTDSTGPSTGTSQFSCSNGVWSAPVNPVCTDTTPPPPVPPTRCVQETVTWTVGAHICSGPMPDGLYEVGTVFPASNRLAGNTGLANHVCAASGHWALDGRFLSSNTCAPTPPPAPPITDPLQLATARNCMACHAVTTQLIGPSFKAIADFYRATPPAVGVLENKIKAGGNGTFGSLPMPANSQVSDDDLAILVPWILSQ